MALSYDEGFCLSDNIYIMTIEIHNTRGKVTANLLSYLKVEVLDLSNKYTGISRAEAFLKEDKSIDAVENKVYEIRLIIFSDDTMVHVRRKSFSLVAKEAIIELKKFLLQLVKKQHDISETILSSVKV